MKIAYQHILRFLLEKPSIEELSNKLFQLGHEHEINGSIFDMEFTPNRGDCLSLLGISRDLNVFYKTNLNLPIYTEKLKPLNLNFVNYEKDICPEISFLNIEIKGPVKKYKHYLQSYFDDLNLNKNNFYTDISNYIGYEMGQPTHCYDSRSLNGDISLKKNIHNSSFKTLLDKSIDLKEGDLVFTNNGKVINLAGIMGGKDTACNKDTKNALIECAYFKGESIIGTATKYDLHSDASHKFEREVDQKCQDNVIRRFIQIVSDHTEIINLEVYRFSSNNFSKTELDIDVKKINSILGLDISEQTYTESLSKLGFEVNKKILVPSFRSDINHQNDLAEELARVIGYDEIPVKKIKLPKNDDTSKDFNLENIKYFLISNGFSEVINPPFCRLNNKNSIKVDNPLDRNRQYLRTNLTDSLSENLIYNEKRQKDSIKFFEISDVYSFKNKLLKEKRLALIISGRKGLNYLDFSKKLDQKYLVNLSKKFGLDIEQEIVCINRETLDSKIKTPIFALEINLDSINLAPNTNKNVLTLMTDNFVKYQPISEYPSSYQDFSFSIKDPNKINEVIEQLKKSQANHLKDSFMFDYYKNKNSNEVKIGHRFIFQSLERTLTDKEIEQSIEKILSPILLIDSVSIPGRN